MCLADHLHDGDPIVALRGLAGTGKTSLIPALIDVLESTGHPCHPRRPDAPRRHGSEEERAGAGRYGARPCPHALLHRRLYEGAALAGRLLPVPH